MYHWQVGVNGAVILGRTWKELVKFFNDLCKYACINDDNRLIIYIHNQKFEFQWIRRHFKWSEIFATGEREPLKAVTTKGLEFRCSYRLSGYGLAKTGEELTKYKVQKLKGDLDYDLVRHSKTPLTQKEVDYCINDVWVVMAFIMEEIERNENKISKIPYTSTGYARQLCRKYCFGETKKSRKLYHDFMNRFTLELEEYNWLKEAFQGGFTHANHNKARRLLENVASMDFTSSYPAVLVSEKFPMSKGVKIQVKSKEDFEKYVNDEKYCCVFPITIYNIESKADFEHPISVSKCYGIENIQEDNGRVVGRKKKNKDNQISTYITDVDYKVYKEYYTWDSIAIRDILVYEAGYLPTGFIKAIAYLYKAKTTLKGVQGKEEEYQHAKALLNALYGMCATDVCRELIEYHNDWKSKPGDSADQIEKYNTSKTRFLHFSWGVFCTAYARRNLLMNIKAVGDDYCYSDTDSEKILNYEKHMDYINDYNNYITYKIKSACLFHGLDPETFEPETIKGEKKPLGVWDFEGVYKNFKTLGAKRYMVSKETDKGLEFSLTVSGINKYTAIPYLLEKYDMEYDKELFEKKNIFVITKNPENAIEIFNEFDDDMTLPPQYTNKEGKTVDVSGKKESFYNDSETHGYITDYLGNTEEYHEKSSIYIGKCEYSLSMSEQYIEYLLNNYI